MIFKTGSKLDAGNFVSYAIDPEALDKISFEVSLGWKKGDDIIPKSNIANNGGLCFYGNKCPSVNQTSNISLFNIRNFSGERLGSTEYAAINVYDMQLESTKFDCIALTNSINNLFLKNSDVEIKKCSIETAVNCFVIDESSFTVTTRLAVQCDTLIHEAFDGSLTIAAGTWFNIAAGQAGANLLLAEEAVVATETLTLTSNGKATKVNVFLFGATEPFVDQFEPVTIGA